VVVTKKKVSNKKAISAMEALGISGVERGILLQGFSDLRIHHA
jgi:hypothetical protein